jgi:hypothetical protein
MPTKIALSLGYTSEELSLLSTWQERTTPISDTEKVGPTGLRKISPRLASCPLGGNLQLGLSTSGSRIRTVVESAGLVNMALPARLARKGGCVYIACGCPLVDRSHRYTNLTSLDNTLSFCH